MNLKNDKISTVTSGVQEGIFRDFWRILWKALNLDFEVTYSNNNKNQYFTLNINKISKELNNKLRYNLDEMASNTIAVINKQ